MEKVLVFGPILLPVSVLLGLMILIWCIWWFSVTLSLTVSAHSHHPFFKYPLFILEDLNWFNFRFTDSFTFQLKYAWLAPLVDFLFRFPNFSILESLFVFRSPVFIVLCSVSLYSCNSLEPLVLWALSTHLHYLSL